MNRQKTKDYLSLFQPRKRDELLKQFKDINKQINERGESTVCPYWNCQNCYVLFPKTKSFNCPCSAGYTVKYLERKTAETVELLEELNNA